MAEKFFKFKEGPFKGLIFHIVFDDVDKHEKNLEFGQYHHKLSLTDETYKDWKPVEC